LFFYVLTINLIVKKCFHINYILKYYFLFIKHLGLVDFFHKTKRIHPPFFWFYLYFIKSLWPRFGQTAGIDSLKKSLNNVTSDVDALKNLKIGGWVQAQFQMTETKGAKTFDGGDLWLTPIVDS